VVGRDRESGGRRGPRMVVPGLTLGAATGGLNITQSKKKLKTAEGGKNEEVTPDRNSG